VLPRILLLVLIALPAVCLAAPAPLPRVERGERFVSPDTLDDLVTIAQKRGDVRRGAAILEPTYAELEDLDRAYKPRRLGGAGVGPSAHNDGIEAELFRLHYRLVKADQWLTKKADLLRVAHHVIAITEVSRLFAPDKPNSNGKGTKEWNAFADETIGALTTSPVRPRSVLPKECRRQLPG
jgi:hypothetical protein